MGKCSTVMIDTAKHLKNTIPSFNDGAELRSFAVPLRAAQSASFKGRYTSLDVRLFYTIRESSGSSTKMTPPRYTQIAGTPAHPMADRTRLFELNCVYPLILLTKWCNLTSKPPRPRLRSFSRSSKHQILEAITLANRPKTPESPLEPQAGHVLPSTSPPPLAQPTAFLSS